MYPPSLKKERKKRQKEKPSKHQLRSRERKVIDNNMEY
jgi:hypothetical protein